MWTLVQLVAALILCRKEIQLNGLGEVGIELDYCFKIWINMVRDLLAKSIRSCAHLHSASAPGHWNCTGGDSSLEQKWGKKNKNKKRINDIYKQTECHWVTSLTTRYRAKQDWVEGGDSLTNGASLAIVEDAKDSNETSIIAEQAIGTSDSLSDVKRDAKKRWQHL